MEKRLEIPALLCGVQLRALPDFLLDHTLLAEDPRDRIIEIHDRWIEFVDRLWQWKRVTFCLRMVGDPVTGAVRLYLLARAPSLEQRPALRRDIEFAIEAYSLAPNVEDESRCLRLLNDAELQELYPDERTRRTASMKIRAGFAAALSAPPVGTKCRLITQEVTDALWKNPRLMLDAAKRIAGQTGSGIDKDSALSPWVPLVFPGPVGSFLVPFKALTSMTVPASISIFLQPTDVTLTERIWIEQVRRQAQIAIDGGPDGNDTDPAANAVEDVCARLMSNVIRRPFLVAGLCAVTGPGTSLTESEHVTGALARTLQAACSASSATGNPAKPAGSAVTPFATDASVQVLYRNADFPLFSLAKDRPKTLERLDYLSDTRGAATLFRLPISCGGGVAGVEVRQPAPVFIPGPVSGRNSDKIRQGEGVDEIAASPERSILLGRFEGAGDARIDVQALVKHMLITGFTGSGKTTTLLQILHQLWHLGPGPNRGGRRPSGPNGGGIPFLVIESAKQEYRGLYGIDTFRGLECGLLLYTLGNETVAPFRLNPFALLPGVRVEAHIGRLQACFEAALPPMPFLPSVLAEALENVYRKNWWTLTDIHSSVTRRNRRFPSLRQFYHETERVISERGYKGDVSANVVAATKGRIKQLLLGSMGFMLNIERDEPEVSPDRLFGQPVVLELNDLNHQDKALVMMFLLTLLREYRELHSSEELCHVTVIEEAHNVLGQVESQGTGEGAGADTRAKSVEAFSNLLAEVRSLGEGLIISDQSPNKLAADAMRNTNLQLAHQLRDARDREAIANAMIMDEQQRDFLGKLPPGQAAVFYTGLQKATFITAPNYRAGLGAAFAQPDDATVAAYMRPLLGYKKVDVPFAACEFCRKRRTCDYRAEAMKFFTSNAASSVVHPLNLRFAQAIKQWQELEVQFKKANAKTMAAGGQPQVRTVDGFKELIPVVKEMAREAGYPEDVDAGWCCLAHGFNVHAPGWALTGKICNRFHRLCVASSE